jgi:DNA-binding CsgD family transcriptional regulator
LEFLSANIFLTLELNFAAALLNLLDRLYNFAEPWRFDDETMTLVSDIPKFTGQITAENAKIYLHALVRSHGLANAAYVAHAIPGYPPNQQMIWTTYDDAAITHRDTINCHVLESFFAIENSSLLPIDLHVVAKTSKHVLRLFGETAAYGIGKQGLVFPVHGPRGDRAFLVVTSNEVNKAWAETKPMLIPNLVLVAQYVHHQAMVEAGVYRASSANVRLTPREAECLHWAAAGKTMQDIAVILSISPRVTRAYLDAARHKLDATNVTHAVGRAVSMGLVAAG